MMRERDINERAEADGAYSRNGESVFTRMASRARRGSGRSISTRHRIEQQERGLRELQLELQRAGNIERREHIRRDIAAKENFLKRLWDELR